MTRYRLCKTAFEVPAEDIRDDRGRITHMTAQQRYFENRRNEESGGRMYDDLKRVVEAYVKTNPGRCFFFEKDERDYAQCQIVYIEKLDFADDGSLSRNEGLVFVKTYVPEEEIAVPILGKVTA